MALKFGISPTIWSNEFFPEFANNISAEECLKEAESAGFCAIEFGQQFPNYPHQLNNLLTKFNFNLITGTLTGKLLEQGHSAVINNFDTFLPVLKSLGCEYIIYQDDSYSIVSEKKSPLAIRPILNDVEWHEFIYKINLLCTEVAQYGLKLVYAPHPASIIASLQDIEQFLAQAHPDIGLVMNISYLLLESLSPICFYEQFYRRIAHIYCQDIQPEFYAEAKQKKYSYYDLVAKNMFTGIDPSNFAWKKLFELLHRTDFQGWVVAKTEHNNHSSPQSLALLAYDYFIADSANLELTS